MGRFSFVFSILVALSVLSCIPVKSMNLPECTNDGHCLKPNTYCYNTGFCVKCTNCTIYYRRNPDSGCAKSKEECGTCQDGTIEAHETIDGSLPICQPTNQSTKTSDNEDTFNYFIILYILIPVILIGIIFYCAWKRREKCCVEHGGWSKRISGAFCRRMNFSNNNNSTPSNNNGYSYQMPPSAPPPPYPYLERNPVYAPSPREDCIPNSIYRPCEVEPNQTANAFVSPCEYVRGGHLGGNTDTPPTETEQNETETDSLINQNSQNSNVIVPEEEETQPSSWVPSTDTPLVTSFSNILNISNPNITTNSTQNSAVNRNNVLPIVTAPHRSGQQANTEETPNNISVNNAPIHINIIQMNNVEK